MDAYNQPRAPKQPCPPHKVLPRNSRQTLRELLTDGETKFHLVSLLKQLSSRPKGPWKDYYEFYKANLSGDIDTMKSDVKKYVEKMHKDLKAEWTKQQTDDGNENNNNAVQK